MNIVILISRTPPIPHLPHTMVVKRAKDKEQL